MSLIEGTPYDHSQGRKRFRGLVLNDPKFQDYLKNRVNEKFYDSEGTLNLQNLFEDIDSTEFDFKILRSMFTSENTPIDWKIGEKISECFLEDYHNSIFPYNDSRDAKDSRSNLPGADLVGYVTIDDKTLFLFGEVKTSDQQQNPPGVVYGSDGLIQQLNEIKDDSKKRKELIMWLGHKISPLHDDDTKKITWRQASISYYSHNEEFKIFGVMIRGVAPNENDLKLVFENVIPNMKDEIYFELISLYLPISKSEYADIMRKQH